MTGAHVAPPELCFFFGHQTINIALLAELGLRAYCAYREIACVREKSGILNAPH